MQKTLTSLLALFFVPVLAACIVAGGEEDRFSAGEKTPDREYVPKLITEDMLSQKVYDVLAEEWRAYDALSAEGKLLSSRVPGHCQKGFDDWQSCEEFLGTEIPNPLEESSEVEKATYAGMPIGYLNTPHVQMDWYGTREGHIEWINIRSGYRKEELRIAVDTALYADPPEEKSPDSGWSIELERLGYLADAKDGVPVISKDSGERYTAAMAYLAQGYVLYSLRVMGEPEMESEVRQTLEELLPHFLSAE